MLFQKLLLVAFLILQGLSRPANDVTQWVITRGCTLKIDGSTNVNKFSCIISSSFRPDTLTFRRAVASEVININGSLNLNVREFDCHNPMMTGDLRKTLKANEFPHVVIRFISLSQYPDNRRMPYSIHGIVSIELAGVTKKFNIALIVSPSGRSVVVLKGLKEIKFSDFGIMPPRKIGGMIRTSDRLVAEFNIVLQTVITS